MQVQKSEAAPREIITFIDYIDTIDRTKPDKFGFGISQIKAIFWFPIEDRPDLTLGDRVSITITKAQTNANT